MRRILLLSILAAGFLPASLRADALLTVDPADGFLNLFPGDTSGWGFHVVDRGGFMVLTSSFFIPDSPFGNYTDYISLPQNFYVISPFSTLDVPFDAASQQGLGEFNVFPSTPSGTEIDGTLFLLYDLYFKDPRIDPTLSGGGIILTADVGIRVVPEPVTFALAGMALLGFLGVSRFRGRRVS
jgi:hypothetical protein